MLRKIKILREKRKLTQGQLAKIVGISRGYLADIERGFKKNPSLELLERIAMVLGVPTAELLKDQDKPA